MSFFCGPDVDELADGFQTTTKLDQFRRSVLAYANVRKTESGLEYGPACLKFEISGEDDGAFLLKVEDRAPPEALTALLTLLVGIVRTSHCLLVYEPEERATAAHCGFTFQDGNLFAAKSPKYPIPSRFSYYGMVTL